jgi:small subunit ribosomal protein S20
MAIKNEKNKKKQSEKRKYKTLIKNHFKKAKSYLKEKTDSSQIKSLIIETQKLLDKASQKGKIHRNKAARKKSQLMKWFKFNNLEVKDKGTIIEE